MVGSTPAPTRSSPLAVRNRRLALPSLEEIGETATFHKGNNMSDSSKERPSPRIRARCENVSFTYGTLKVELDDGRTIIVPKSWYPRLLGATDMQLECWELSGGGSGIHWPQLDEDLSVEGLLLGTPAPNFK